MKRFLWFVFVFAKLCGALHAQTDSTYIVSLVSQSRFSDRLDRMASSRAYRMAYIGVPLIAGGLIIKGEDDHFRSLRNGYSPSFRYHYDDYLQYLPAATLLGLKIGGVKGRSSTGRMLVSDAFSAAIMGIAVNSLKSTVHVMRPDGVGANSFPSGHTAMAFMTATMMHKEYGGVSPWYSIGAYSVATATGITRQLNNKHWLSDVMVGAGIGILSVELGYFLADLIFKDKGITDFTTAESFDRISRPSFSGLYLGYNVIPGKYRMGDYSRISLSTGCNAGIEGAWFFNPYWGIGGRCSAANMMVSLNTEPQEESLDVLSGYIGAYFSYPLTSRWLAGSKLLAGYSYFQSCSLSSVMIGKNGGVSVGTGGSLMFRANPNLGIKFFLDYNVTPSPRGITDRPMHVMTLGGAVNVIIKTVGLSKQRRVQKSR